MSYQVVYLELALKDVSEIRDYLSQFYPSTPMKFLTTLKQSIEAVRDNPFLYAEYEDHRAYRRMLVLDYLVFYKVYEESSTIEIHRVLHGKRDIKAYLP